MTTKRRLSASVDAELLEVGRRAVRAGHATNLSAWVNDALRLKWEHDKRLEALADFVAVFESEHGEISEAEMVAATRRARARAQPARSLRAADSGPRKR